MIPRQARIKHNQEQLIIAEEKFGKNAPTETNCVWFNVCCELGTENGCIECTCKKVRESVTSKK